MKEHETFCDALSRAVRPQPIYEFGDFRLDAGRRRLERTNGEAVTLGAKSFDALVHLVGRAGEPISRKTLIEALWPDAVVEENNLTQVVSGLRRALGEGYVVTLPGRGYQFVVAVRPAESGADDTLATPSLPGGDAVAVRRWTPASSAATILGIALAAMLGTWAYVFLGTLEQETRAEADGPTPIAVLPFASLDSDLDEQAFAAGLTDELISSLAQLPGLRVTGRTSSFAFRDSARSAQDIAAALGVQYIIEGSVGRDGNRLRVRVQLSDASGFSVWADSYDRSLGSIFDVQDEIVHETAEALHATLGLDRALGRIRTDSAEAYELYVAARAPGGASRSYFERVLELVDRALHIDPAFMQAWVWKSQLHSLGSELLTAGKEVELVAAEEAALQAIALAPDLGDGHVALGQIHAVRGHWLAAERSFQRALALDFPLGDMPMIYSAMLIAAGRFESARGTLEEMLETDPFNGNALGFLMETHELLGDREGAEQVYLRGRALLSNLTLHFPLWVWLGRGEVERIHAEVSTSDPQNQALLDLISDPDQGLELLGSAVSEPASMLTMRLAWLSVWAAYFGDAKMALWLLRESTARSAHLAHLVWLPVFREVRQSPEFKDLLVEIGLVDYWRTAGWPDVCRPVDKDAFVCF